MTDDLKHYKAPVGSFQLIRPAIAEFIIVVGVALVIVFGVLPDLHAWIAGKPPVSSCK